MQDVRGKIWLLTSGFWLLCLVLMGCRGGESPQPAQSQERIGREVLVDAVQPIIMPVRHTLKAVGSFFAEDEVAVSAEVAGRVAELLADEGYPLERGQVVLRLEQERPRLEVERAEAEVREARADLELQEITLKRQTELLREEVISQQAYDDVTARARLAAARLERAEANLRLARKSLKDTTVVSPLNGVITERHVAVGEYVKAGDPLFTAVKTNPLKLYFTLPERFAGQIRRDQKVNVRVKAYPDRDFSGRIYFINPQVDPQTRAIQLKALVDNRDGLLKPGFFADVHLILDVNEEAVVLPQEAVVLRESRAFAYVVESGVVRERVVELGEQFNGKVEILSGIHPGEIVVTSGNHTLTDGQTISVVGEAKQKGPAV